MNRGVRVGGERSEFGAVVELWRERDGLWRWQYREPRDDIHLRSNESYDRKVDALDSARRAYPGVPIRERRGRVGRGLAGVGLVVLVAAALPALIVVGLALAVRLVVRWRQLLRRFRGLLHTG